MQAREQMIAEIESLKPWHQFVQITEDLSTGIFDGRNGGRQMVKHYDYSSKFICGVYGDNLINKTMLDCGCNAGGHLFGAAKQGIKGGLGFDAREHGSIKQIG